MQFHYKYYISVRNENKEEIDYKYIGRMDYNNKFSMNNFNYSIKLYRIYNYNEDEDLNQKRKYRVLDTQTFSEMTFILMENPITLKEEEAYYDTYYTLSWANDIIYGKKYDNIHFVIIEELVDFNE